MDESGKVRFISANSRPWNKAQCLAGAELAERDSATGRKRELLRRIEVLKAAELSAE
jgi:hypothetical protein